MISIMELMEKKTPSIKKNDRKKGMTLVEVMAAMAILSIIFVGISGLISSIIKSETKSNALLDNATIAKSILSVFEIVGDGSGDKQYISNERFNNLINNIDRENNKDIDEESNANEYKFNTIDEAIEQIINGKNSVGSGEEYKYTLELKIDNEPKDSNLYKITVEVYDSITEDSQIKYMYIYRTS